MRKVRKNKKVGIFRYPGCQEAAVHGLKDLFEVANRILLDHEPTAVTIETQSWGSRKNLPDDRMFLDAVVIPPSLQPNALKLDLSWLSSWIVRKHKQGTVVCSVCAGAFILARSGLLDGRTITTHWALEKTFVENFPNVELDVSRLVISDGDLVTAGGLMAWMDLGLQLIERFMAPQIMLETARHFIVDPGRREQKTYFSLSPNLAHGDEDILRVQHWVQRKFAEKIDIKSMSKRARLGERTFLRRFSQATGLRPTEYIQQVRVSKAKEMLEFSKKPIDQVAWESGYEDATAFRRVFLKMTGTKPGEYRKRFGVQRN